MLAKPLIYLAGELGFEPTRGETHETIALRPQRQLVGALWERCQGRLGWSEAEHIIAVAA
jgi:hypothetical protein